MKRAASIVGLSLCVVTSSCGSGEVEPFDNADAEEAHLGQAQQALCAMPTNPPVPVANTVVPGSFNEVTSGTYDYGNGACDGYVVKFVSTAPAYVVGVKAILRSGAVPAAKCSSTRITMWTWFVVDGTWEYAGSDTITPALDASSDCVGTVGMRQTNQPKAHWQTVVKAQVRTTSMVTFPNGTVGSISNNAPVNAVVLPW